MKLYVDPGVHKHACALFLGSFLQHVHFATFEELCRSSPSHVVIENPRINGATDGKDPNDQMDLSLAVGDLRGMFRFRSVPVELVTPGEWKGTVKKWIHHRRVWDTLADAERVTLAAGAGLTVDFIAKKIHDACARWAVGDVTRSGKVRGYEWAAHNLLDAVALGLERLGRTGRGGHRFVVPRV